MILRKSEPSYQFSKNGERINHLLYMDDLKLYAKTEKGLDSLIQTVRVFSADIGKEFGIDKCAMLVVKRGSVQRTEGVKLPDEQTIKGLNEGDTHKYLGILQADKVHYTEMKAKVKAEYKRRVRKILETKLNGKNIIKGINTWAIALLRYSAAFLEWTRLEKEELDRDTRKLLTMHKALHPKSDVDRLYLPRNEGGRGLQSTQDTIELAILGLDNYVRNSHEKLITAAREDSNEDLETEEEFKQRKHSERKGRWCEKVLHGQYPRQTKDIVSKESWKWLKEGSIKRETESLIFAAQEQALRTNQIKAKIDQSPADDKCRMGGNANETINHLTNECAKMAQKEYKRRHDLVGKKIHWEICRKFGVEVSKKWYQHEPEAVVENEKSKILWDMNIQTDHIIEARPPDMVDIDKAKNHCQIIDFAIPYDSRVEQKEVEKKEKYQDSARELKKIWNMKATITPVVIGALGAIPKKLRKDYRTLELRRGW